MKLLWAFQPDQLLRCKNPAGPLRHVQRQFQGDLEVVALTVGEDPGFVQNFLRRERVQATRIAISEPEAQRVLGSSSLPALFVVRGGQVIAVLSGSNWSDSNASSIARLEQVVQSAVGQDQSNKSRYAARPTGG